MKKKIQVIIAGIIIVAGSFLYAHIGKNNYIYDRAVDTSEYITTGSFLNETVQERFKSNEDTLDGVRVKCRITGVTRKITPAVTTPKNTEVLHKIFPFFFASDKFPLPSRFPTIILPPYPKPVQPQIKRFLVIFAIELAAIASEPRCPSMTEYIVNPPPQASSLKSTG